MTWKACPHHWRPVIGGVPSQKPSKVELWCFLCCALEYSGENNWVSDDLRRNDAHGCHWSLQLSTWIALGPISISDKTSYRKISSSLQVVSMEVKIMTSLGNLASAGVLSRCLLNFRAIKQFWTQISRLRNLTRSYDKTSYRMLKRLSGLLHANSWFDLQWCLLHPFKYIIMTS